MVKAKYKEGFLVKNSKVAIVSKERDVQKFRSMKCQVVIEKKYASVFKQKDESENWMNPGKEVSWLFKVQNCAFICSFVHFVSYFFT